MIVVMATSDWQEGTVSGRAGWKYASVESGVQCVISTGTFAMPQPFAVS